MEGLQGCGSMIMSDGGAMHIAAALNRPIIALFGDSSPKRWRPWGVPYTVMQSETGDVKDIEPSKIIEAWFHLINSISTHKKII
jgi:ADP-heptose:LPS heptosyltransferase